MLSSSQRKGGLQANTAVVPPGATSQKFASDLARYRTLAEELAVQRKSGQAGPRRRLHRDCPAPGATDAPPALDRVAPNARTGRTTLAVGTILVAGLVLSSPATWLRIEGSEVKAPGSWEDAENASGQDTHPEWQPAIADSAGSSKLLSPLESALIDSTAQAAALDDLRARLQRAEALSDSHAARLVLEQAHSRILEEALAAREAEASAPVPSIAPSDPEGSPLTETFQSSVQSLQPVAESPQSTAESLQPVPEPPRSTAESLQPVPESPRSTAESLQPVPESPRSTVESLQPVPESPRSTAESLQPVAESPRSTAESLQPVPESPQSTAESLQPVPESPRSTVESLQPTEAARTPLLPTADLGRLMLRARELREHGDIAAARTVLESSADSGHGPALFQLAETYDPATLSIWRTFGTKGDLAKARELYLKAEEAGVIEATERLKSLPH